MGSPIPVPGVIEIENFNEGGEGVTYHDTDRINTPQRYRPNEGVDIEERSDGGFQLSYVETGEWLEYTIDVAEAGSYLVQAKVASLAGDGQMRLKVGTKFTPIILVPSTESWVTLTTVESEIILDAGEQILRL